MSYFPQNTMHVSNSDKIIRCFRNPVSSRKDDHTKMMEAQRKEKYDLYELMEQLCRKCGDYLAN